MVWSFEPSHLVIITVTLAVTGAAQLSIGSSFGESSTVRIGGRLSGTPV